MKPHWYCILLVLADKDQHGSGVAREVKALSGGEITLWPVTLYGTLAELEEQGWIESLDRAHPVGESERKRFFRITRPGRRALEAETRRLAALVNLAERRARPKAAT